MSVRVAALYDVHGNLPALEAVLRDVLVSEPDLVVFGGDLVWGPWPHEVLERARSVPIETRFVKGNTDRAVLTSADASFVWARKRLAADDLAFVDSWVETLTLDLVGLGEVLFCHATPRSDTEIVLPGPPSGWAASAAGVEAQTIVCGHTHVQFAEEQSGRQWVNPGSVGNPTIRAVAWWALLGPTVELRTTDYDTASTADPMRKTGFPRTDFADELIHPYTHEQNLPRNQPLGEDPRMAQCSGMTPDTRPRLRHMICPACGRDRPISRFRGRNKVPVEGRVITCRSCEREWWAARGEESRVGPLAVQDATVSARESSGPYRSPRPKSGSGGTVLRRSASLAWVHRALPRWGVEGLGDNRPSPGSGIFRCHRRPGARGKREQDRVAGHIDGGGRSSRSGCAGGGRDSERAEGDALRARVLRRLFRRPFRQPPRGIRPTRLGTTASGLKRSSGPVFRNGP